MKAASLAIKNIFLENQKKYIKGYLKSGLHKYIRCILCPSLLLWIVGSKKYSYRNDSDSEYEYNCKIIRKIDNSMLHRILWKLVEFKCLLKNNLHNKSKQIVIDKNKDMKKDYISIVCIIKNEALYLKEWVEFHILQGVDRIYILDNESTDNTLEVLNPYIQTGKVIYTFFPGKNAQLPGYRYIIKKYKKRTKWLAIIDADEFLFPVHEKLSDILEQYEKHPAVGVNWIVYGPGNHQSKPNGLLIKNYTETFEDRNNLLNLHIKSIVQPNEVSCVRSAHFCYYKNGRYAVNEKFEPINGDSMYVPGLGQAFTRNNSVSRIRINHYWTKSREELKTKCQRGFADGNCNLDYEKSLEKFNCKLMEDKSAYKFLYYMECKLSMEDSRGNV